MTKPETDWNLLTQAQISIGWLLESAKNENASLTEYRRQNENCEILNPGILMAYAYIAFVYPKETALNAVDVNDLNFSKFTIEPDKTLKPKDIVRRLRNSIAHGRFTVSPNAEITFEDNCRCGKDPFRARISCGDFGHFVQCFCGKARNTHFAGKKASNRPDAGVMANSRA